MLLSYETIERLKSEGDWSKNRSQIRHCFTPVKIREDGQNIRVNFWCQT